MIQVPARFQLGGFHFTVEFADDDYMKMRAGGDDVFGLFIPAEQRILLARPRDTISEQQIHQTFCHELFHALFSVSNYAEMGCDEKLVDQLGHLLFQFIQTFEFERPVPSSG